jgi:hypothetical protein
MKAFIEKYKVVVKDHFTSLLYGFATISIIIVALAIIALAFPNPVFTAVNLFFHFFYGVAALTGAALLGKYVRNKSGK